MKKSILQDKYPVFTLELDKHETPYQSVDEMIRHLKRCIVAHSIATFIAVFDHYEHTKALDGGEIADDILDAQNIIFCFGLALPTPAVMAVRPRSIGVVEMQDKFVINFLEAPMPLANSAMEEWALSLRAHKATD